MKIEISCSDRSITIATDRETRSAEERKALSDKMYAAAIDYIIHGIRPKKEGGAK